MMKPSLDRTLKLLWLAIGVLLLTLLAAGGVMILAQWIGNRGAGDAAVQVASENRAPREEPRAVRYGPPMPIRGTATRIVMVGYGTGHTYGPGLSGDYDDEGRRPGAEVNVMFLDAAGARLLLDRPAFIHRVSYPQPDPAPGMELPAGPPWISYVLSLDDANRNGRLDERDASALYVSDLDGKNLRPVLRPPLRYESHHVLDAGRMLVYALEPPAGAEVEEDRMRQRAFIYDVASGRLSPYAALDSAAARAGQILRR
ncbi:MAG TPA: hypothetical protein VGC13_21745 [Longimicrobium sp.]|jgi:hypothetical protein|uniref:hypothetical protein n=1 Tax=Longimicrobium sp. TaxID=2029185 RepID=UPI002EDB2A92